MTDITATIMLGIAGAGVTTFRTKLNAQPKANDIILSATSGPDDVAIRLSPTDAAALVEHLAQALQTIYAKGGEA